MNFTNDLKTLINQLSEEKDSNLRQEIENRIEEHLKNGDRAVVSLINIFEDKNSLFATRHASFLLIKKIDLKNISEENLRELIHYGLNFIFNPEEEIIFKKKFCDLFCSLKKPSKNQTYQKIMLIQREIIQYLIKMYENDLNDNNCLGMLLIMKTLYKGSINSSFLEIIKLTFPLMKVISDNVVRKKITFLESSRFNESKISDQSVQNDCNNSLNLLNSYIGLVKSSIKYVKKYSKKKNFADEIVEMSQNLDIVRELENLLFLKIGNLTVNNKNIIFNITKYDLLNEKLNKIKYKALSILIKLYHIYSFNKKENLSKIFRSLYQAIIKVLLESLFEFFNLKNFQNLDQITNYKNLNELLINAFDFLSSGSQNFEFFEIFSKSYKIILKDIILPNLITKQIEYENFKENPKEYLNYNKDLIYFGQSNTLTISVSNFLNKMTKYIDGILTFLFDFILELLNFSIYENELSNLNNYQNLNYLKEFENSNYFKLSNKTNRIETSLFILSFLKEEIIIRDDLIKKLDNFVKSHSSQILNKGEFIQSKFVFFIAEYIELIPIIEKEEINNEKNMKYEILNWLINISQNNNSTLGLCACDNLNIIEKLDLNEFVFKEKIFKPYISTILKLLFEMKESDGLINTLTFFLSKNKSIIFEDFEVFSKIINTLILLVKKEVDFKLKNYNLRINKYFEILIGFTSDKKIVEKYYHIFNKGFSNLLFNVIDENNNLRIWFEIYFCCYLNLIKNKKNPEMIINFDYMLDLFKNLTIKNKGDDINDFSDLLIVLICKFTSNFNIQKISDIFFIIEKSIHCQFHDQDYFTLNIAKSILLLQILIQNLGTQFNFEQIMICHKIYIKLQENLSDPNSPIDKFLTEKIDGIFLSLFYTIPTKVWDIYKDNIFNFTKNIIQNSLHFETPYEIKLLTNGIISILKIYTQKNIKDSITISHLLNFLIPYMKLTENLNLVNTYKQFSKHRSLSKEENTYLKIHNDLITSLPFANINFLWFDISREDMEYLDYGDYLIEEHLRKFLVVKKIVFNLGNEYLALREFMELLKRENESFFVNIRSGLSETTIRFFDDVLYNIDYVEGLQDKRVIPVRRILMFKRSLNN